MNTPQKKDTSLYFLRTHQSGTIQKYVLIPGVWDPTFRSSKCYQYGLDNLDERMPLNIGNLIALIEKVERVHTYTNPDRVAEALINR